MKLDIYGWDRFFEKGFKPAGDGSLIPARVYVEHRGLYGLYTEHGELQGEVSGRFRYGAEGYGDYPAVGDWVAVELLSGESRAVIREILPRRSRFSRKVAGALTQEQVVASNFDYVFILNSLNHDLNPRRLERYLTMAWESGGSPVVILSKKDLADDADEKKREVESICFGVPVFAVSAKDGDGCGELSRFLAPGRTVVFLGSSGAGKSTLVNRLAGADIMEVREIREDDSRGRHTTTFRQLVMLPGGSMVIDTPGMRELQLWEAGEGLEGAFGDIGSIAAGCRFSDCRHESEPGCAVRAAVREGLLSEDRLISYKKLQKELMFLESKQNQALRLAQKRNEKSLARFIRNYQR